MGIPEVCRPAEGRLQVWIPWRQGGNRKLLKLACGPLTRAEWDSRAKRWLVARGHFLPLIEALKNRFGQVRVITAHCDAERCDIRCQKAEGAECVCSCGGQYHGGGELLHLWLAPGRYYHALQDRLDRKGVDRVECMSEGETLAWIVEEGGRLTGEQLPVPDAEAIMAGFIRRFGQRDTTRIARAAFAVHRGMWMGAPITSRRFTRANDEFFARRVLARLDRETQTTRVA